MTKPETTQPKRPRGRPATYRKPVKFEAVTSFHLTPEQHAKLKQLGGSEWLRKQIDKARI